MISQYPTAFIHSDRFEQWQLGQDHPFKPQRSKLVYDLLMKYRWLSESWMRVEQPALLTPETMALFHDAEYIAHLQKANDGVFEPKMIEFNLGTAENPIINGLFDYAALSAGASYRGMELLLNGEVETVFSPSGGMHHAARRHADGFCYINDCGIVIERLMAEGKRVVYIDIDAHHGNGIQDAFYREPRVLKISIHESGETLYPWGGYDKEIGGGKGRGYNVNVPLPPETDDVLYIKTFDAIVPPLVRAFDPDIVVSVIGIDTVAADPLTHLSLTNNGFLDAVTRIRDFGKPLLALGGGGYNMDSLARSWALAWAVLNHIEPQDDYAGAVAGIFLGQQELEGANLRDMRQFTSGPKKTENEDKVGRVIEFLRENIFPVHGIA